MKRDIEPDDCSPAKWYPLTSRQLSIWLELKAFGIQTGFRIGGYFYTQADFDYLIFRAAVRVVMDRNDALRLFIDDEEPRQCVVDGREPLIEIVDLSSSADADAAFTAFARRKFESPLPLADGPLFELLVCKLGPSNHRIIFYSHHLISDGISGEFVIRQIAEAYRALVTGSPIDELAASSYLAFIDEDVAYRASVRAKQDLAYWTERFSEVPDPLFPRRQEPNDAGGSAPVIWRIDRQLYDRFLTRCEDHGLRPLPALLALVGATLIEPGPQSEIVIGVAVPGRTKRQAEHIGQFAGLTALRFAIRESESLVDIARSNSEQLGRDYKRQRVPVDDLTRALQLGKLGRRSVFDVFLSFIPSERSNFDFDFAGQPIEAFTLRSEEANPLAIYITEMNRGRDPRVELAYNPSHLSRDQVEAIRESCASVFRSFVADPRQLAGEFGVDRTSWVKPRPAITRAVDDAEIGLAMPVRVVSTFTAEPVRKTIHLMLRRLGCAPSIEFAGYDQVFQELLNPYSALRRATNGINLVLLRVEDWARHQAEDAAAVTLSTTVELCDALEKASRATPVKWLLAICPPSPAWDREGRYRPAQSSAEKILVDRCRGLPGVQIAHYDDCRSLYIAADAHDELGLELGRIPYSDSGFTALGSFLARRIHLLLRRPLKVAVVDCDNTLWRGVVGEDGPLGVELDECHLRLQHRLVEASKAGMLICLCSKNEEADVDAVFVQRYDMILRSEHIVSSRINWNPKSANIREIAEELGLGLDSFVFLDDNPVEIAEVRAACPEVASIRIPPGGSTRRFFIQHLWPLDPASATAEDAKRTRMYRENAQRRRLERSADDFGRFIESLALDIRVAPPERGQLARMAQLTERTTQFNINREHRTAAWFEAIGAPPNGFSFAVTVSDRFGDYGLVGVVAGRAEGDVLHLETCLMSCRVLGRGVEHRMVAVALGMGCTSINVKFKTTPRNKPIRNFLATLPGIRNEDLGTLVVPANAAATVVFQPQAPLATELDDRANDVPVVIDDRFLPGVPSETWEEIARTLDSVPAIEKAVKSSDIALRNTVTPYRAPRNSQELLLSRLIAEALDVDRIGIDDDFMAMGLQSLAAVQLISRLRSRAGIDIPVRALFEGTTIAKLTALIGGGKRIVVHKALTPLQLGKQGKVPVFCFHSAIGDAVSYLRLARALGAEQPVYGLEASGMSAGEPLHGSIEEMAGIYLDENSSSPSSWTVSLRWLVVRRSCCL